jgi:hypothetical protein
MIELDTVLALAGIQVALNAPFYLLSTSAYLRARACEAELRAWRSSNGGE